MFKFNILNRFLMRRFFSGVGLVMLVVCGIILAVTFVERLPANPTVAETLADAWLRLLEYVPLFLPMAVFMGTLLASYNLTKSSESIIVSSAGLSPYQAARPLLIGAALIGVFATTVINPYSVRLSTKNISADQLKLVDDAIWLRESSPAGFITMKAQNMHAAPGVLSFENAVLYVQNTNFKITERVIADTITLSDEGLSAANAQIWDAAARMRRADWHSPSLLNPQNVLDRYMQPDQISFWQLPRFIEKMNDIGLPVRGHLIQFWTLLFLPLTMIAMASLGVAFSQTKQRRNYSFSVKFGMGIITCFALYFMLNMFSALGSTGALPPLLAVVAPPLIIIAAAGAFIASFDTI
ncbi:MAG: LptF/LptG family permease [Alphaproteobacteria bacterium]|nr:LptF/LptG family permease [Alphaproteobacteria bacterium]